MTTSVIELGPILTSEFYEVGQSLALARVNCHTKVSLSVRLAVSFLGKFASSHPRRPSCCRCIPSLLNLAHLSSSKAYFSTSVLFYVCSFILSTAFALSWRTSLQCPRTSCNGSTQIFLFVFSPHLIQFSRTPNISFCRISLPDLCMNFFKKSKHKKKTGVLAASLPVSKVKSANFPSPAARLEVCE